MKEQLEAYAVEASGQSSGTCDCCGRESHTVWGWVHRSEVTVAAYFVRWTSGHLNDVGANIDLIIGKWGEGTSLSDRFVVSLIHREMPDGTPSVMVTDARADSAIYGEVAASALRRDDVIGTPLAAQIFDLVDAIYIQDGRFF